MNLTKINPEQHYTLRELSELADVAISTLKRWIALEEQNRLPSIQKGRGKTSARAVLGKDFLNYLECG